MQAGASATFHVGVIMDGNGRWAEARGLGRIAGHARGARRVTEIVNACPDLGVTHLTLYAFSTENWRRPLAEIEGLMRIFRQYILGKMEDLRAHDVRVRFIGMRHRVSPRLRDLMNRLEERTRACRGLNLTIAIDYGGRDELTRAIRALSARVCDGTLPPEAIDERTIAHSLDTGGLPDPDFILRTSGEMRISNFLIWQSAYAEYAFLPKAWPEFTADDLAAAVNTYAARDRRFGEVTTVTAAARR